MSEAFNALVLKNLTRDLARMGEKRKLSPAGVSIFVKPWHSGPDFARVLRKSDFVLAVLNNMIPSLIQHKGPKDHQWKHWRKFFSFYYF